MGKSPEITFRLVISTHMECSRNTCRKIGNDSSSRPAWKSTAARPYLISSFSGANSTAFLYELIAWSQFFSLAKSSPFNAKRYARCNRTKRFSSLIGWGESSTRRSKIRSFHGRLVEMPVPRQNSVGPLNQQLARFPHHAHLL